MGRPSGSQPDRRAALIFGAACAAAAATRAPAWSATCDPSDLDELASRLRAAPREQALDVAARAIAAGADRTAIFGATFLAGIREIQPRPVGNALHAVMAIESALRLTDGAPADQAWLAALWAVDDFKAAQETDHDRGDWTLPPRQRVSDLDANAARVELESALAGFDRQRADAATCALLTKRDAPAVFDVLWPFAARSFRDAGHRIVYAAQVERVVRRLDPRHAESALRSVAIGLADDASGPHTSAFEHARELVEELPVGWQGGGEDATRSLEVLRALRARDPKTAQRAVVDALASGIGPMTVWDGMRLHAAELMLHRPARRNVFPVHVVTELEAFGHAWSRAREDRARRILIVQAAAWVALVRDAVVANNGAFAAGDPIDALGADQEPVELRDAVDARSAGRVCAAIERSPGRADEVVARLRADLIARADQNHQFKLAAAALEESARAHPRWSSRVLASGIDYVPAPSEPVVEVHERSRQALRRAGVS